MKLAIIALVLAVSLVHTQAYTGSWSGYGGIGVYGGIYGHGLGGLLGSYHNLGLYGKRATGEETKPEVNDLIVNVSERTECVYTKDVSILSCHGPDMIVECETDLIWDTPVEFHLYGIGKKDTSDMFMIYPRRLDNSAWSNEEHIKLYQSEEKNDMGLRVRTRECFDKLKSLFGQSLRNEKVFLDNDENQAVHLYSDLLIAEVLPKIVKQFIESREEPVSIGDLADRLTGLEDLIKEEFEQTMSLKDTYMKKIEDLATRVFRE